MKHYKRERSGRPLVDVGPSKGDPDGHGRYGILDDDGDTVLCHECGARVAALGNHAHRVHGMTAREYKLAHGLPLSKSLSSAATRARLSKIARDQMGTSGWQRFEAARDPIAASAARDQDTLSRAAAMRGPEVAIANGRAARRDQERSCPVCGTMWCALPGGYDLVTCSRECQAVWQAQNPASHMPRNPSRDGRIYADVVRRGINPNIVAAEHGITRTRVMQIVRRMQSTGSR